MEETDRNSGIVIFFGVLLLIVSAGLTIWFLMNRDESIANADKVAQTLSSTPDPNTPYTSSEVATHNKKTNCWTIVDNKIYNITKIIKEHPAIAEYELSCGIDGTSAIKGKILPTGEKDANGVAAPQSTEEALKGLQVGKLKSQ